MKDDLKKCSQELPASFDISVEQPPEVEITTVDKMFIKQLFISKKGMYVPQHSHKYDHSTLLCTGSISVWADGVYKGDRTAPDIIYIQAEVKHTFLTLEDNTLMYCLHNAARPDVAAILEEHQIVEVA